jgi:hypothetical protein
MKVNSRKIGWSIVITTIIFIAIVIIRKINKKNSNEEVVGI